MKTDKGLTPACDAQCKKLQNGLCKRLNLGEIEELLEKTDWDDMDKGEILTPYILRVLQEKCSHEGFTVKKYTIGCGYYGYCKECCLSGEYANTKEEAEYNFKNLIKES